MLLPAGASLRLHWLSRTFQACLALMLMVGCGWAQQATVQGEVRDDSNAVVPGATITVENTKAGTIFKAATNESGFYSIPGLVPGTYSVTARATGFAVAENNSLTLDVGEVARVDFALKPGAVSESVNVTATATALNTDTSVVGQVITNRTTVELPLNGRNYLQLAQLTAGVSPDFASRTTSQGTFSAVGQNSYQVSVQLDGIDNSSRASGGELGYQAQAVTPSVDAVEEF
ncbi:MAG TPA: carboxypeptidase-like regulatory domain-containing protein, partial [Terriglobia bacterium]|nr:carboxypeptidase-like regulatory domain-containing protein [Terriglobia bacterium]